MSIVCGNSIRATSEGKAKQNSARNNMKCSESFQFLCDNSDRTWFFNTFSPGPLEVLKTTAHGTRRMLMHEKPCLIPILMCIKTANA